jgi:transformation/transcription domain-associated protein
MQKRRAYCSIIPIIKRVFIWLMIRCLDRKIETRKRNLQFHLPTVIPLAPQIRLVQDDRSNISLQEIYENHAKNSGFTRDDPVVYYTNRLKEICSTSEITKKTVD